MTRTPRTRATLSCPVAAALALVLAALGCEPPTSGGPAPGETAVWSLDTVPELVVLDTILEAEPLLMYPVGAARLSNGNVVVADQWAKSVVYLDPSGGLVRTVGRAGGGPGEFGSPSWVGQCGPDSVFVWDVRQSQMSVLDSAGTIVREYAPPRNPTIFRCTRGGSFAVFGQPVEETASLGEALSTRLTAPLRFEDASGDSVGAVGNVPVWDNSILGKITQYALAEGRLYVGTVDSASLDVYGLEGGRLGTIPLSVEPRSATEANVEAWLDAQAEAYHEDREREMYKRIMRNNSAVPEQLPLYTDLAVDPEGVLWVVLSSPGDGETRFLVVAPDGTLLAELRLPTEVKLYEVGHDYLLAGIHHGTGIPGIALYRFTRGSP
ncbi:MAG TPA: hypothetical protein VLH75_18600 [Longimicrobiales bacterium]|nr:hypothetical protein [Longimicrobiales bacterium]